MFKQHEHAMLVGLFHMLLVDAQSDHPLSSSVYEGLLDPRTTTPSQKSEKGINIYC